MKYFCKSVYTKCLISATFFSLDMFANHLNSVISFTKSSFAQRVDSDSRHGGAIPGAYSVELPWQFLPPKVGAGLVQVLVLDTMPPSPQLTLHLDQLLQSAQPPLIPAD